MADRFEAILDESISALQAGVPIEEILEEVPEYAPELRSLLYASALLADPNPRMVPEEKKAALREEYMRQVADLPAIPTPTVGEKTQAIISIIKRRSTRKAVFNDLVTITITVILTLSMAALLLTFLATDSLPGDFLYGVKRMAENTRLILTFDEIRQIELENEFNQRRLAEIEQLIGQNRAALVEFRGVLETKGENIWVIEGLTVVLPPDLVINATPQEGDNIEVVGLLRTNNILVADRVEVLRNKDDSF